MSCSYTALGFLTIARFDARDHARRALVDKSLCCGSTDAATLTIPARWVLQGLAYSKECGSNLFLQQWDVD